MKRIIRNGTLEDTAELLDIYNYYVKHTSFTFDVKEPTFEEYRKKISDISNVYPWIVCELDNKIVGFAYASAHKPRCAYDWSADATIYLKSDVQSKGIGAKLYEVLFDQLKKQNIYNVYAGITVPNEKSIALHKKFGFEKIAVYKNVGFKLGKWSDVAWYHLQLIEITNNPPEPLKKFHDTNLIVNF